VILQQYAVITSNTALASLPGNLPLEKAVSGAAILQRTDKVDNAIFYFFFGFFIRFREKDPWAYL